MPAGIGTSVIPPFVVFLPFLFPTLCLWRAAGPPFSVNQRLPSNPTAIPVGKLLPIGTGTSVTAPLPLALTLPIFCPKYSVNHRLPSHPVVISAPELPLVGT